MYIWMTRKPKKKVVIRASIGREFDFEINICLILAPMRV